MPKLGLKADFGSMRDRLVVPIRLPATIATEIEIDIARKGFGGKGRSRWFREAVTNLHMMAFADVDGYVGGLEMLSGGAGRPIQVTLTGESVRCFHELTRLAEKQGVPPTGCKTRVLILAASTYLVG